MPQNSDHGPFDDLIAGNRFYTELFALEGLAPVAARGLAVLLCMDSRIEPLGMLGLEPGDAKILRNAGGRVTPDVIRTLAYAVNLLGVERVLIVPHRGCGTYGTQDTVRKAILDAGGPDPDGLDLLATTDQVATLRADLELLRSSPYLPPIDSAGAIYDVDTGCLGPLIT